MDDDIVDRLTTLFWAMKDAGRVQDKNTVADAIAEIERLQNETDINRYHDKQNRFTPTNATVSQPEQ
jgi:uncharacterized protein with ParB-like and HNH nuclease domain